MTNEHLHPPTSARKPLVYGSVCSGIEAATVAWHPLGWQPAFFSEIDAFPRAVLQHRYPDVPLHGDFTTIQEHDYAAIDLLVGGTPCQSFSVAGLRKGLADERGNLTLEFVRLAQRLKPRWLVWENVPGVLSIDGGRAFGSFLGGLAELGYGFAYRVLDAQHFGVPQRRRRVFVVGYLGDWRPPAAVLFERESLCRDLTPSREAGPVVARSAAFSAGNSGESRGIGYTEEGTPPLGAGASGTNQVPTLIAIPINTQLGLRGAETSNSSREGIGIGENGDPAFTLQSAHSHGVATSSAVRRLTPRECERLQGFPNGYTAIPSYNSRRTGIFGGNRGIADGPRYKALGNSMAVPCMRWIGERIDMVESQQLRLAA